MYKPADNMLEACCSACVDRLEAASFARSVLKNRVIVLQGLLDMGVDLISTDDVVALREFVTSRAAAVAPRRPLVRWRPHGGRLG